jgi:hypothetical protein
MINLIEELISSYQICLTKAAGAPPFTSTHYSLRMDYSQFDLLSLSCMIKDFHLFFHLGHD